MKMHGLDRMQQFLERSPWFRTLSPDLRGLVLRTVTERNAVAGEYIARTGEPCTHWYGLIEGYLQMYVVGADGGETTLYCLREGEWGGEGSLLKQEMRKYDLRALTDATMCLVPADTFDTLRQSSIAFNHFICEIMNARMGVFVGLLEATRLRRPEMRVARGLLMLIGTESGEVKELNISQHELALISGLSRQRVNSAISEFNRLGIVRSEIRKSSLVVHLSRLRDYVMAED